MLVCLDAAYTESAAHAAGVLFAEWTSGTTGKVLTARAANPAPYASGAFYARELPVLRALLAKLREAPTAIVIDGYVHLDGQGLPGLGAHLYETLNGQCPVIGVAKTPLRNDTWSSPVLRGQSTAPLRVTAIGLEQTKASALVGKMHGAHRIPVMMKLADQAARAAALN